MFSFLWEHGFVIIIQFLATLLLLFAIRKQAWRRLGAPFGYLCSLLLIDGFGRQYVLHRYGLASVQYRYFYWLSDVVLALAAFIVVCALFRRACADDVKLWRFVRLILVFVFVLVLGISLASLTREPQPGSGRLETAFFFEFQQNLYFTCLVLNTLLYIMLQQFQIEDGELHLLVCGMGLQFAGPAANFALASLTSLETAHSLYVFLGPLCTLGMLLVWLYAVIRIPKPATARVSRKLVPILARSRNAA